MFSIYKIIEIINVKQNISLNIFISYLLIVLCKILIW